MAKKKGSFKDKLKFLVPIIILLAGVAFVVTFEFYIKDKVNTIQVVVAKENIEFKEEITEKDVMIANVKKDNQVQDSFRPDELDYILGKLSAIEIKKGTQLYPDLIDDHNLVPDEKKGEFIAPLPDDWIFAVAGSLRRAYIADIYVVGDDEQVMLESLIKDSKEYADASATKEDNQGEENLSSDQKDTQEITEDVIKDRYKPILTNVRISSVKDSSNSEVTESQESPNSATGSISNLEIVATNKMLQTIQEKTNEGYKLYIVHKFDRVQDIVDSESNSDNDESEDAE
mgnify:CR=1 FL=1